MPGAQSGSWILVVEDDKGLVEPMQMILSAAGFRYRVVNSGVEALQLLTEEKPDLVLLDVMMPGMDGYELLVEMQKRFGISTDSVIMMSGLWQPADMRRAEEAGISSYLKKPFTRDELIFAVRDNLATIRNAPE